MSPDSTGPACLSDETVLAFVERRIQTPAREVAETHVAACAQCRVLVAEAARHLLDGDSGAKTRVLASPSEDAEVDPASSQAALPLEAGHPVGRYTISAVVGSGGMGVVYAAHDPGLDRTVALKVLRTDRDVEGSDHWQARLLREAQSMARLSHPNVVAVHDVGRFGSQVFVAMELVRGQTLRRWLGEHPRSPTEILAAFAQAGEGLVAAHAAGLVHRDFKPDNVLVGTDGRVRVTDFGLARPSQSDERSPSASGASPFVTRTGAFAGTPAYMAPEQLLGGRTDARTDQFSFCVALYEALYGSRPFEGGTIEDLTTSVVHGAPRPPPPRPEVPESVRRAILRGLSGGPENRFGSMEELLEALEVSVAAPLRRRRRLAAAALALAAVGGGAYALVALAPREPADPRPEISTEPAEADAPAEPAVSAPPRPATAAQEPPPPAESASPEPRPRRRTAARPDRSAPAQERSVPAYDDAPLEPAFVKRGR